MAFGWASVNYSVGSSDKLLSGGKHIELVPAVHDAQSEKYSFAISPETVTLAKGVRAISNRWAILFVLFFARTTMAFQFQAVAALSPLIAEDYGITFADIGLLIGLYLAPGVFVAIPGGVIAARFGDKRVVSFSMVLMLIGSALIGWGPSWETLIVGRILAGTGGVILNIVMTKMLVDWFVDHEISTAMAIFINSWPVGIALALLTLPNLAAIGGLELAWGTVLVVIALGLIMFVLVYRVPENAIKSAVRIEVGKLPLLALFLAAIVWALYNTAFAMVFSFGPAFFSQSGWDLAAASSVTSIFIISTAISLPLGGIIADRTGRRDAVIMVSLLGYTILMPLLLYVPVWAAMPIFVVVGLLFGLGAGPIVTLPSLILQPQARAFGMGVFYSVYYGLMMAAPTFAGALADRAGNIGVAFVLGAVMLVIAMVALGFFRSAGTAPHIAA